MVPELTGATPPFWGSCVGACVCACVRVCVCPGKRGVLRACLCRFLLTHTPFHPSSRHTLQAEAARPPARLRTHRQPLIALPPPPCWPLFRRSRDWDGLAPSDLPRAAQGGGRGRHSRCRSGGYAEPCPSTQRGGCRQKLCAVCLSICLSVCLSVHSREGFKQQQCVRVSLQTSRAGVTRDTAGQKASHSVRACVQGRARLPAPCFWRLVLVPALPVLG